jgi:hypothetical protein
MGMKTAVDLIWMCQGFTSNSKSILCVCDVYVVDKDVNRISWVSLVDSMTRFSLCVLDFM